MLATLEYPSGPLPLPGQLKAMSPTALRAFKDIAGHWQLSAAQQRILLGSIAPSTFSKYMRDPDSATLSLDTAERVSHIYGIFKSLNVLFSDAQMADTWISKPNTHPLFKGRSALEFLLQGHFENIVAVRAYLDSERGW